MPQVPLNDVKRMIDIENAIIELKKNNMPIKRSNYTEIMDGISFLSKEELQQIDEKIEYKNSTKYLDDYLDEINTCFETCDFSCLITTLDEYDKNVRKHYNEYKKTMELWDRLKFQIRDNKK